jgi:hypothetical protein
VPWHGAGLGQKSLLYCYVDVGTSGPLPAMYPPGRYPKRSSAQSPKAAALLAPALLLLQTYEDIRPAPPR